MNNKEELILSSIFDSINSEVSKMINPNEYKDFDDEEDDELDDDEIIFESDELDYTKYKEYINLVLNDTTLSKMYHELLDGIYFTSSVDLQDVVSLLCNYYLQGYQNKPNSTYKILAEKDFKYIYKFFKINKVFASTLLNNYYLFKIYDVEQYNIKIDKDLNSKFNIDTKIMFISDYMRLKYELCVNELMELGLSQEDVPNVIYLALSDEDISFLNKDYIENLYFLKQNKRLMTRILYSDIFEDSFNWPLDDESAFIIDNICYSINMNKYVLPEGGIAIEMINRFTNLIFDPATRETNRNSLDEVGLRILKRVNPVYKTERVMVGYENK